jgi:hypothetical protein
MTIWAKDRDFPAVVNTVHMITGYDKHMRTHMAADKVEGGSDLCNRSVGEARGQVEIGGMGDNDWILGGRPGLAGSSLKGKNVNESRD